jgi:hypothetical protein
MMYIALNPKSCTPKVVSLVRSHSLFLSLIPAHIDSISCKVHTCIMLYLLSCSYQYTFVCGCVLVAVTSVQKNLT